MFISKIYANVMNRSDSLKEFIKRIDESDDPVIKKEDIFITVENEDQNSEGE